MSLPNYNRPPGRAGFVDAAADRCVKCALCLPVCPTWTLSRDEAESPRGRIALLQGVARNAIPADDARPHIERCLSCMACQKVCPASVPYGALLDAGQAMLRERGAGSPAGVRLAARLVETPAALRAVAAGYRVARRVPGLAALSQTLKRALSMPDGVAQRDARLPQVRTDGERGTTIVLSGCIPDAFERHTSHAIGVLLNAAGYGVQQIGGCCGALSRHSGDDARASSLAASLVERVARVDPVAVVHPASGCAAVLSDVARHVDSSAARTLADRLVDVGELLDRAGLAQQLARLPARPTRVALHASCTQRNVTGGAAATRALINALPGVRCVSLTATSCCGAAGSNMLTGTDTADALAARTLAPLDRLPDVDILLTPNVGCAWHLRGFRARQQRPLRVMHPAMFLALRLHGDAPLV